MSLKQKVKILSKNPRLIVPFLGQRKIMSLMPDAMYLKITYRAFIGEKLDLVNPRGFNEKLQWLKLYDRNPAYTSLVDKCSAKELVAERIGEQYIVPTLGVWKSFDQIDFNKLPNQFVLKTNHDSGTVIVCSDKKQFDLTAAKKTIDRSLSKNFFYVGREWPYKNITPVVFAEEFLSQGNSQNELIDYKFLCFNGEVKCLFVCTGREKDDLRVDFFDKEWNPLPFERHYPKADMLPERPQTLEEMIVLSEKLSQGIPFVRVDFYYTGERIYFGEMTFYPGNGTEEFSSREWDERLGSWIDLSLVKERDIK